MAIPDFQSIMLPLLDCVKDGKEWNIADMDNHLTNHFSLTEQERTELKPSSSTETLFHNRMLWASFYLKKAGLLIDPRRSFRKISSEGLNVLKRKPEKINIDFLMQYPSFIEFYSKKKDDRTIQTSTNEIKSKTPEDMIIEGYKEIQDNLEKEILEKIKKNPPEFFEQLVVNLVEKMGYGLGTVIGKSGDKGVDGMIKQDTLGLNEIYLQAKRWDGTVPAKEIRDFAGSLLSKKSKKGIFITTSDFSDDSIDFIKSIDNKIVLINGQRLAHLMFEHNVGFLPGDNYQLKKIDEEYFS